MRTRFFMESDRLEAFSDGVIAVIITIMVLDLRPPHSTDLKALVTVWPPFVIYALSFLFVGIYWNNHHHMLRATRGIDGSSMWANLHLLFWLSLVPFSTAWLGGNPTAVVPTALYAFVFLMCAFAYAILVLTLLGVNGREGSFARAVQTDRKGRLSIILYAAALAFAFLSTIVSDVIIVAVALIWLVPDRRFEPVIASRVRDQR